MVMQRKNKTFSFDHRSSMAANKISSRLKTVTAISALAFLAGCASSGGDLGLAGEDADYRGAIGAYANPTAEDGLLDPVAAAAYWSVRYDQNPGDWQAGVKYSAALRKIGSLEQAVNVMTSVSARHGDQAPVALEMGKTLIEAGRAFEAVRFLEQAVEAQPRDWRTLSAYGVALDQIGEHGLARTQYEIALSEQPNSAHILNNKGLSLAMSGDLLESVTVLRAAVASPGADARVRQNLALALAIKGDLLEAERLARSDLPPQIADQNVDYLRSLVAQPAYWQDYAANAVDTPEFEDFSAAPPAPAASSNLGAPTDLQATIAQQPEAQPETQPEPQSETQATLEIAPQSAPTEPAPIESALAPVDAPEILAAPDPASAPTLKDTAQSVGVTSPTATSAPATTSGEQSIEDILADAIAEDPEPSTAEGAPLKN